MFLKISQHSVYSSLSGCKTGVAWSLTRNKIRQNLVLNKTCCCKKYSKLSSTKLGASNDPCVATETPVCKVTKNIDHQNSEADLTAIRLQKEPLTYLGKQLESMIKANGPLSVYDFMKLVVTNPWQGYYTKPAVFGSQGDFVTSPEISQVFGEWQAAGKPKSVRVIELGPGKGTLMSDMLRTWKSFPEFYSSIISVDLVEASEPLARVQAKTLAPEVSLNHLSSLPVDSVPTSYLPGLIDSPLGLKQADGIPIKWHLHLYSPLKNDAWLVLLAHEFFDALPVLKFKKTESGWREIMIDIDTSSDSPYHFTFFESPVATRNTALLKKLQKEAEDLQELEIAPETSRIIGQIGGAIKRGGAGLIFDYGEDFPQGNTLRGIRKHKFCYPLSSPGLTDLSTNVDFSLVRSSLLSTGELKVYGPSDQGSFLLNMGIQDRLQMLMRTALNNKRKSETDLLLYKKALEETFHRLTGTSQMGRLYKVISVTAHNNPLNF